MQANRDVRRISGELPAIHAYFDLPPESPDGAWVVYFEFTDGVPGPGDLVLVRPDGSERRVILEGRSGNAHSALTQQWVDANRLAFKEGQADEVTTILDVRDGGTRDIPGAIRMLSPDGGRAVTFVGEPDNPRRRVVCVTDIESGEMTRLFDVQDALAIHPFADRIEQREGLIFMNAKWAPDGSQFFAVFNNEVYRRDHPDVIRVKSIVIAGADGSGLRYLKEIGHHPMWSPDGSSITSFDFATEGGQDFIAQPVDSGEPCTILERATGVHPTLSADGRRILTDAFYKDRKEAAILMYDTATGDYETLATFRSEDTTHETGCHPHPAWSRDESRAYFNAADDGTPHLYAMDL